MKTIIFKIDEENHEKLKKIAKEYGLSISGFVRQLIIKNNKNMEG